MGAFFIASMSMFVSCKDYEDDINANTASIEALNKKLDSYATVAKVTALQTALEDCQASCTKRFADLQSQLTTATSQLEAAIANKADASTVNALADRVTNLEGQMSAVLGQLDVINAAIGDLQTAIGTKVSYDDLATIVANLQTAIDGKASTEYVDGKVVDLRTALQTQIDNVLAAIDNLKATDDAQQDQIQTLANTILDLQEALNTKATSADIESLQNQINDLANSLSVDTKKIDAAAAAVAAVTGRLDKLEEGVSNLTSNVEALNVTVTNSSAAIAGLEAQVNALENYLKDINADEFKSIYNQMVEFLTGSTSKKTLSEITTDIETLKTQIADVIASIPTPYNDEELRTLIANLSDTDKSQDEQIAALNEALKNLTTSNSELAEKVAALEKGTYDDTALKNQIASVREELIKEIANAKYDDTQMKKDLQEVSDKVAAINADLDNIKLIVRQLRSLIVKPTKYYQMIGVIPYNIFGNLKKYEVDSKGETSVKGNATPWGGDLVAEYHANPSNADIANINWEMVEASTTNIVTRGHNDETPVVPEIKNENVTLEDGIVKVPFTLKHPENLNDAVADENGIAWVSSVALQAQYRDKDDTKVDTTITSDYAVIIPTYYGNLLVANHKDLEYTNNKQKLTDKEALDGEHEPKGNTAVHLLTTLKESQADEEATFTMVYTDSINLKKCIFTHYSQASSSDGTLEGDFTFTDAEFEAAGLEYQYYVVPSDGNELSCNESTGLVKITAKTKADAVGKYYYVIAEVKKKADGEIVAVGYVKIFVIDAVREATLTYEDKFEIDCEDDTFRIGAEEAIYLAQEGFAGLTSDILNEYYLPAADGSILTQYKEKKTSSVKSPAVGKVKYTLDENGKPELQWLFTSAEMQKYFLNEDGSLKGKDVSTIVRLFPKDENSGYKEIWVTLVIPAENITIPSPSISDADKILKYWYQEDSKDVAAKGQEGTYREIHLNVEVPDNSDVAAATNAGQPQFAYNLNQAFVGEKIKIRGVNEPSGITGSVYFSSKNNGRKVKGDSRKEYKLSVNDEGTELSASYYDKETKVTTTEVVATIDITSSTVEENDTTFGTNVIDLVQTSEFAKDLLNFRNHKALGKDETFTVYLLIKDDPDYCLNLNIANADFHARFLQPVYFETNDAGPATDAYNKDYLKKYEGGWLYSVLDLCTFYDWRDIPFSSNYKYFKYYGIESIVPDFTKATTDINEDEMVGDDPLTLPLLSDIAPSFKLEYIEGDKTLDDITTWNLDNLRDVYGYIHYINNGQTVAKTIHIYVPVVVTYYWGTYHDVVKLTVDTTMQNAKAKK